MMTAVTTALTTVIQWVGTVLTALTGEQGQLAELLPLFAIGIAISAFLFALNGGYAVLIGDNQCKIPEKNWNPEMGIRPEVFA